MAYRFRVHSGPNANPGPGVGVASTNAPTAGGPVDGVTAGGDVVVARALEDSSGAGDEAFVGNPSEPNGARPTPDA